MAKPYLYLLILIPAFCWTSCKDDEGAKPPSFVPEKNQVFLINEGNFQWGNPSLGVYLPDENKYEGELFQNANGYPPGDVFQSMIRWKSSYLMVMNNSGKILDIDTATLKVNREITGFRSPRYVLPLNGNEALVSDLYSDQVSLVDLNSGTIQNAVQIVGWTEQMMLINDEVWVCNRDNNKIYLVQTQPLKLIDSMELAHQVHSMVLDNNQHLWVLCQGDAAKKIKGGLFQIKTSDRSIVKKMDFEEGDNPFHLCKNAKGDSLFFLNKNIYAMSVQDAQVPSQAFIELPQGTTAYGLGIHPQTGYLYFSNAHNYVEKSTINIFHPGTKERIYQFKGGLLCNGFLF